MLTLLAVAVSLGSEVVTTKGGVVVCDEPLAAEVGASILRKGGNAVDAAVGVAFALAVVEPSAGNIGGGGFMLVRMKDGRQTFIDYRECAPRKASRDMYLDAKGELTNQSTLGPKAAGVPGTVAGMTEASKRFGRLPWADLVQPSVRLASTGFRLSESQAGGIRGDASRMSRFPTTLRTYLRDGRFYEAGELVRLPELGETLARVRDGGADGFYRGVTAKMIADHMAKAGGLIDEKDLADYRVRVRKPLVGTYRGYQVVTAPPPSSGGTALLEMLNILEGFESKPEPGLHAHLIAEAMKRAFADRSDLLGDPDFVSVPVGKLTSKSYAKQLREGIKLDAATPSAQIKPGAFAERERKETTHFSVIDGEGNAVANTYTLNGSYGSADTVEGAGFLLNNEMDDFAAKPGSPNMFGLIQGEKNAIAPGKRPLSSMTPTIVLRKGKVEMVLGSPGGPTIINTVLHVLLNRVDMGLSPEESVKAPRFHHQWLPDRLVVERAMPAALVEALKRRGQAVTTTARQGIANCIFVDPKSGTRTGVADRRYRDAAAATEER